MRHSSKCLYVVSTIYPSHTQFSNFDPMAKSVICGLKENNNSVCFDVLTKAGQNTQTRLMFFFLQLKFSFLTKAVQRLLIQKQGFTYLSIFSQDLRFCYTSGPLSCSSMDSILYLINAFILLWGKLPPPVLY